MDGGQPGLETRPAIGWFHSLTLPGGETTAGEKPAAVLAAEADVVFKHSVAGKRVLDIGAWDGFFSFEAERRGAAHVLATDHFCWSGSGWGTKAGFDYAHGRLGSRVASLDIDVPRIAPETVGMHDVVLFLGVLYHVKDPLAALERAASAAGEMLVVETATALDRLPWPVARYYPGAELNNDATNFWAPNRRCLEGMARDLGFTRIEMTGHPATRPHWRRPDLYWKHNRVFMHAWR
ncbi:methyltransferase domain-containing protein [Phenylobacterium sp.]|jgi:tRNA (mo5U34)-methyltransferase|uniref:methyltransferase domain-containing protein n=1 Tax=Phenylobacterium sp. TaxID=1871053 RepID=UPI00121D03E8|nr:methyltransferase domain-containing protein [Phenylobacterium sp.]THD70870.1 MAG: methyltransferase type 11 [Phenylobacterium sp.]